MKGLGIDLCGVERIERELKRSDAFLHRFFTNSERAYIASRGQMGAQSAAAMFAAVWALGRLPLAPFPLLVLQVLAGAAIYGGLALVLRLESMRYLMDLLRGLNARRHGEAKA